MAMHAKFFTVDGVEVLYGLDAEVRTLRGGRKVAADVTPEETVVVEVWNAKRAAYDHHHAMRDEKNFDAMRSRADGRGVADPTVRQTPEVLAFGSASALAAMTSIPKHCARGSAKVRVEMNGTLVVEIAAWVKAKVRNFHLDGVLGMLEMELDAELVRVGGVKAARVAPDQREQAFRVAQNYLLEHGFFVERLG
jgi:hypothetical protein